MLIWTIMYNPLSLVPAARCHSKALLQVDDEDKPMGMISVSDTYLASLSEVEELTRKVSATG